MGGPERRGTLQRATNCEIDLIGVAMGPFDVTPTAFCTEFWPGCSQHCPGVISRLFFFKVLFLNMDAPVLSRPSQLAAAASGDGAISRPLPRPPVVVVVVVVFIVVVVVFVFVVVEPL